MNTSLLVLIAANVVLLILFWRWLLGSRRSSGDPDGTDTENEFRRLLTRVDSVWKDDLSTDHIRKIEKEIEKEQTGLFERAVEEEGKIKSAITHENGEEIGRIKARYERLRGYQLAIDRLTAARKRLYKKRQRRHVWIGLSRKLGTGPAMALEFAVLVLTVIVLALLFLEIGVGYERLDKVDVSVGSWSTSVLWVFYSIDVGACMVFLYEFFLRLSVAEDKRWFWRHNWIDLASSIPIPPISPEANLNILFRILRLLRLMRVFRVARIVDIFWNSMERLERNADVNLITKSVGTLVMLLILGTTLVTLVEPANRIGVDLAGEVQDPSQVNGTPRIRGASSELAAIADASFPTQNDAKQAPDTLENFSETLWWTFNAIAPNAGYADLHKPTSNFARLITAILLLWGAVVMGAFVATLTASFNGEKTEELRLKQLELSEELTEVRKTQNELARSIEDSS